MPPLVSLLRKIQLGLDVEQKNLVASLPSLGEPTFTCFVKKPVLILTKHSSVGSLLLLGPAQEPVPFSLTIDKAIQLTGEWKRKKSIAS